MDHERWARMVLTAGPVCAWPGCTQRAKIADHVIPVTWGGEWYGENGQGLCQAHHNNKTVMEVTIAKATRCAAERVRQLYAALAWLPRAALDVFDATRGE